VFLFLNNDVEARSAGWLAAMLGHAQRPEVGAVGALLRYPDLTVQHAGIVVGMSFGAGHVQQGLPPDRPGYMLMTELTRNCTAVTGACMMTRRSCFEDLGGFDAALPVAFNDVDYCLRLRDRGLLVVYTPLAELIHHESKSRGHADDVVETPIFRNRWRDEMLRGDPYYNHNLTHFDPYCRLSTEENELWNIFRSMLETS
jgi:GT2 family glycosyltransferase